MADGGHRVLVLWEGEKGREEQAGEGVARARELLGRGS